MRHILIKSQNSCFMLLILMLNVGIIYGQNTENENVSIGPVNGSLVITGGGGCDSILSTFIKLAGGKDAPIVVIPTASGSDNYNENNGMEAC